MSLDEKQDYVEHVEGELGAPEMTISDIAPTISRPWIFYPALLKLNILLCGGLLAQVVCGYDGSMMNGLQTLDKWQAYFNKPNGTILGTMNNGMTIGTLIIIPFVTYIVDYIGRRWSIIIGCAIICVGAVVQGFARNFGMFVGGRIILGIGGVLSLTAAPPLVTECAFPTQRPVVTALLMPSWPLGSMVAALVTWAPYNSAALKSTEWGWRIPSLLQLAFPLLQMILAFFGPESPRWLIDKGREEEARQFFVKYHAFGDEAHPVVAYELAEITATIEEEKLQHMGSWLMWFKSKPMLHRLFLCWAVPLMQQLSGNALISYYLNIMLNNSGVTTSIAKLKVNLGLQAWTLVCSVGGAWLVGRFRRRTLFLTGYSSMIVSYTLFTVLSALNAKSNFENQALIIGVVFFIFFYGGVCYQICSPIAFTYTMEICPYSLRSKGSMIYQFAGALVGFFNNYVNPVAMTAITWKYYIVYCVWLTVQLGIVFFLFPETYGRDLEEVNMAFKDDFVSGREAMIKNSIYVDEHGKLVRGSEVN